VTSRSSGRTVLYTVGHSNHEFETFLNLLDDNGIQVVVDVRSSPYSRYTAHFNREAIQQNLRHFDIRYVYMGHMLGGHPDEDEFYDTEGHVLYWRVAESQRFRHGISQLVEGAEEYCVALMCSEEDPTDCHRRKLIGRVLKDERIEVLHIRGDGRIQTEQEIAELEEREKSHGQETLFDREADDEWKSTQSVTRRNPQKSSSRLSSELASNE